MRALHDNCKVMDSHLKKNRYLIGDQLSVADFFMAGIISAGFMVFHKVFHADYMSMTRWFNEISNMPMYKDVAGVVPLLDLPFPTLPAVEEKSSRQKLADTPHAITAAV